ncbi:MAG: hypothetical protein RI568_01320 [Natronomonas sp.]|uniref:homing endonuclease associated repeat-containing protein n=1 Tax=Natronomonas sp. TaxID=2184060 RepID=UPI0028700B59|nr:hypothetical protein [Natronomonas sp.]MDR9429337.1 hypothetical protein [Natronomonas sp.]
MPTTDAACLEALREAAERLGASPTKAQYEELGLKPASATIIRQIGGWNRAKERAGLETNASRGSRVQPKPEGIELPEELQWEDLSVDQRWHYRNREWNAERTRRRRATLRRWVNEKKRREGCTRCEVDAPACLDYHHPETVEKRMSVGTMVTYGYGKQALESGIRKCAVLCANCHRKEHHSPPTGELRRWVYERKRAGSGCSACKVDDAACLEFHHEAGEKVDTIARMLADGRPRAVVRRELEKCTVLCANCHRKRHFEPPERPGGEHDKNK